jgi:adenylate cyclase
VTSVDGTGAEDPVHRRGLERIRRANRKPELVRALRATREALPGDQHLGDALSTAADRPLDVIARYLAEGGSGGPESASREAGLAALQVWQALSERMGRGAGTVTVTILFTDIVGFSSWVLEVGDELALELLRGVAGVVEPTIAVHRGRVVKRLGDGHMAVFSAAQSAVDAALEIQSGLESVEVVGHRPRLRAGLHMGQPRRLGGDYLGTDVNIAARVGAAARAGELLISEPVLDSIDCSGLDVKRRRGFRAKGAPRDLQVFSVARAG